MTEVEESSTPLVDAWIAEIGEERVVEIVENTRRRAGDGSLPVFDNEQDLKAFLRRGHRQSA
jgi:hypothetical protein